MKQLWAPWRLQYVGAPKAEGCIFCAAASGKDDRKSLIVHRSPLAFVILNLFPYNSGHAMVVPYRHHPRVGDLSDSEKLELMKLLELTMRAQEMAFHPEGTNVGMNLGRVAGAGIEDHLHIHVVPRWVGDTNFMPVLGDTKVIPEHLEATYQRLHDAFVALTAAEPARQTELGGA